MKRSAFARIWLMPLLLGLLSLLGLVVALLADGWADVLSWVALAIPVLLCVYLWWQAELEQKARPVQRDR